MHILTVDDEQDQREMLCGFLRRDGYTVLEADSGERALEMYKSQPVDVVLLDQKMTGLSGAETLQRLRHVNPHVRVIMITAHGAISTAVDAMKHGALDFIEKPVDLRYLKQLLCDIEEQLQVEQDMEQIEHEHEERDLPFPVVGTSPPMQRVLSILRRVSAQAWPVLLRGETGTGKELFARLVHGLSSRHAEPFVEVNCAAIPENLFEAELFGHEKGAFTGAERARSGHFENANRGTLFLDEVGELPLILQAKLLRVLQEQRIQRVGSSATREVDVRIVAASNRNLHHMVQQGSFREDLYYRLNVFEVEIPPLRERKEDVPALVEFFLHKYALHGHRFSSEALDQLLKYDFPGNVRELEHVVQRTTALSRTNVVQAQDLPAEITRDNRTENPDQSLCARVAEFEQRLLEEALADNGGVQVKAAAQLGISERVLRYKLAKYRTGSK